MTKRQATQTARISVTEQTVEQLRAFKHGFGGTYDEVLQAMMRYLGDGEKDMYLAGRKFKQKVSDNKL